MELRRETNLALQASIELLNFMVSETLPFGFVTDGDGVVLCLGRSLIKSVDAFQENLRIYDIFEIRTFAAKEKSFKDWLAKDFFSLAHLRLKNKKLRLKAVPTFFNEKNLILWSCQPAISSLAEVNDNDLALRDFLPIDPIYEFLINLKNHELLAHQMETAQAEVELLARFHTESPNPILRLNVQGEIELENTASRIAKASFEAAYTEKLKELAQAAWQKLEKTQTDLQFGETWFRVQAVPLQFQKYVNLYLTDISAEKKLFSKQLEEQRQIAAEEKLTHLAEVSIGVAHEINNPLAVIIGNAQVLKKKIASQKLNPEELDKSLDKMIHTSLRISNIVKGLRAFAENEKVEKSNSSLRLVIDSALAEFKTQLTDEKISVQFQGDWDKLEFLPIALEQSQRIFSVLIKNSIEAICDYKKTQVLNLAGLRKHFIQFHIEQHNQFIKVGVVDSGIGIKPELQSRIMQPFFTTREVGQGVGLGLAIARGLMANQGGRLNFDGTSRFTRFVLSWPLADESLAEIKRAS